MDRRLTNERKAEVAPAIARQLQAKTVDVMQSWRFAAWSIFYVDTHQSDEAYVFYADDPRLSRYVTLWSGAARWDEGPSIRAWTVKNAPGIPGKLAGCFAWYVTHRQ